MPITQRTTAITSVLLDGNANPVVGAIIAATLNTGGANASVQAGLATIDPVPKTTITAADGSWTLNLVPPGDITPATLNYTITLDKTGLTPLNLYTTSFSYSATPLQLSTIIGSSPTPSSTLALVYDYVIDAAGNPIVGLQVTATLNSSAINLSNFSSASNQRVLTTTDTNGYYQFKLIPTNLLSPTGLYYNISEGFSNYVKTIQFTATGGRVNNLIVTPLAPVSVGVATPPPGAFFIYTTTWGRQTMGAYGTWL